MIHGVSRGFFLILPTTKKQALETCILYYSDKILKYCPGETDYCFSAWSMTRINSRCGYTPITLLGSPFNGQMSR